MIVSEFERSLQTDPSSSFWLKKQLLKSQLRDPVDALRDAENLVVALKHRLALIGVDAITLPTVKHEE
jgi:hypothetical protein